MNELLTQCAGTNMSFGFISKTEVEKQSKNQKTMTLMRQDTYPEMFKED